MANHRIPERAQVERSFTGVYEGDTLEVILYAGTASDGHKTNYRAVPCRWLVWHRKNAQGQRVFREAIRYSGRRYDQAFDGFDEVIAMLADEGVKGDLR